MPNLKQPINWAKLLENAHDNAQRKFSKAQIVKLGVKEFVFDVPKEDRYSRYNLAAVWTKAQGYSIAVKRYVDAMIERKYQ